MPNLIEKVTGDLGDKKRYREYKARVKQLPEGYRLAAGALERYLLNLGPSDTGTSLIAMLNDLAELLEQSVASGTALRDVIGADPADFADTFMDNYSGGSWIRKERQRLTTAVVSAEAIDDGKSDRKEGDQK
jgi:DNA-binding ferritin-like protein (Dps family)